MQNDRYFLIDVVQYLKERGKKKYEKKNNSKNCYIYVNNRFILYDTSIYNSS